MAPRDLRLRVPDVGLLALPWDTPLDAWDPTTVPLRDIPVGPSRHLVRFVETGQGLWALKALPAAIAEREYTVLRHLEDDELAAVRPAGVVVQPTEDSAILVTRFLEGSWQYRRLLMRVPASMAVHRGRLFDAMAVLLVELHRNGVYWGDCSLANTLFMRDGQAITAWMVDAETAEIHSVLSDGQREMDLEVMVENVAGGLLDVAARREEVAEASATILDEARSVAERYEQLWTMLHDQAIIGVEDHYEIESRLRRLNDIGFALDEVRLESTGTGTVGLKVTVADRRFHSAQLARLTGLQVGEGQARILLNDLHSFQTRMQQESGTAVPEEVAARHWMVESLEPGLARAREASGGHGAAIQAYCDLLEVRWLLSEEAGYDVGDLPAVAALRERRTPDDAAATLAFVDLPTEELPRVRPGSDDDPPPPDAA